jgi:hypothetical protein
MTKAAATNPCALKKKNREEVKFRLVIHHDEAYYAAYKSKRE